jgi:hypothetical protein
VGGVFDCFVLLETPTQPELFALHWLVCSTGKQDNFVEFDDDFDTTSGIALMNSSNKSSGMSSSSIRINV